MVAELLDLNVLKNDHRCENYRIECQQPYECTTKRTPKYVFCKRSNTKALFIKKSSLCYWHKAFEIVDLGKFLSNEYPRISR